MTGVFNPTIARITLRALIGRRRFLLLLPLPLLVVGVALLAMALDAQSLNGEPNDWASPVILGLGIAVALPVMALIVGAGVLGSEIDDGTVSHILAKPIPRSEIILSKLAVAILVTTVTVGVPMYVVGLLADSTRLANGLAVGTLLGAFAYNALFLALSLVTRRPVLLGLIYVMIWEGLLTSLLPGAGVLAIREYIITVTDRVAGTELFTGTVSLGVSLGMTFVFVVGATLLSIDRLRSFSVVGETS
jgi:ABC-2 type transport system permease protein